MAQFVTAVTAWVVVFSWFVYILSMGAMADTSSSSTGAYVPASTGPSELSQYQSSCAIGDSGFPLLYWRVHMTTIDIAVQYRTDKWVGLGFSSSGNMVGSHAVIYSQDTHLDTVKTLREYQLTNLIFPTVVNPQMLSNTTTQVEVTSTGPLTTLWFTLPLSLPDITINPNVEMKLVWAIGSENSLTQHSSQSNTRGRAAITFSSSVCRTIGEDSTRSVHGVLMTVGLGILLPVGTFVARYAKALPSNSWFHVHIICQTLGLCSFTIGFALAIKFTEDASHPHFSVSHSKLGLAVFIVAWFQFLNGVFRADKQATWRVQWEHIHRNLGRVVVVAASVTIFTGMAHFGSTSTLIIIFAVWLGVYVLISTICEIRSRASAHKSGGLPDTDEAFASVASTNSLITNGYGDTNGQSSITGTELAAQSHKSSTIT